MPCIVQWPSNISFSFAASPSVGFKLRSACGILVEPTFWQLVHQHRIYLQLSLACMCLFITFFVNVKNLCAENMQNLLIRLCTRSSLSCLRVTSEKLKYLPTCRREICFSIRISYQCESVCMRIPAHLRHWAMACYVCFVTVIHIASTWAIIIVYSNAMHCKVKFGTLPSRSL